MVQPPADVFISYKAEDRGRLVPLVVAMEAEGISVWWDAHIGGGDNWRQDIQNHLDAAKCVVVVWSKRSVGPEGEFVRDEAMRAKRRRTYLPILIDKVEPPLGFGEVQALSLRKWKGDRSDPRLAAITDAIRRRIAGDISVHHPALPEELRVSRRAMVAGGLGVGTLALAGASVWLLHTPNTINSKRIAVLPFANLSGDPEQAYFADGIAEELRAALSRIGMEVIGRTSSVAVKDEDTKSAASKLGVANILTGSVRRSPQMVRINAQLVSGKDGVERWAQSYDRAPGDAIKIQADIATNVAQALSIALGRGARAIIGLGGTSDSVAQDLLLQSRVLVRDASSEEAGRKAIALAEAALVRDPHYADANVAKAFALASIAGSYASSPAENASGLDAAYASARRALQSAPNLASAHAVLAFVENYRLNFRASSNHIGRALSLSPDDPEVLALVCRLVAEMGDGRQALGLADRLLSLDPFNSRAYRRKSEVLISLRDYHAAIDAGRKAIALSPAGFSARVSIGDALVLLGRYREARVEYAAIPAGELIRLTGEAIVSARTGDKAGTMKSVGRLKELFGATASYQYSEVYAQLREKDRAFAELSNAVAARDPGLSGLRVNPFFDPIRGDPRYDQLVRELKFP